MKYQFSFTAAYAMIPETIMLATQVVDGTQLEAIDPSVMGKQKGVTNKRQFFELRKRLRTLNRGQMRVLATGNLDEQKQIIHLALCKTYAFYRDFVTEVLLHKVSVFDTRLHELDYNSFVSSKKVDHPELDGLAVSTERKVRLVLTKMLKEVGLLDGVPEGNIIVPNLSATVREVVMEDSDSNLEYYLQHD